MKSWFTPTVQRALELCPPVWKAVGGLLVTAKEGYYRDDLEMGLWGQSVKDGEKYRFFPGFEAQSILLRFWTAKLDERCMTIWRNKDCSYRVVGLSRPDQPTRLEATAAAIVALCEKEKADAK